MPITQIPALGWNHTLRLASDEAELLVTTDIGPRILSYRLRDGENVLRTFPEQMGTQGEDEYVVRGGHRLWISPEIEITYAPDNSPVEVEELGGGAVRLSNPATERCPVRKELTVSLAQTGSRVSLEHRLINHGAEPLEIAAWGITVMRPGGWEIIPQPPLGSHETDLLPQRVIVPWTYTDFSDDRWRFGPRYWRLVPQPGRSATKLGFALASGWAAYALPDALFLKTFDFERGADYPDFGCNFETFAKAEFIELESLSPRRYLAPGEAIGHGETWHLFADTPPPPEVDDAALAEWLAPHLTPLGLRP